LDRSLQAGRQDTNLDDQQRLFPPTLYKLVMNCTPEIDLLRFQKPARRQALRAWKASNPKPGSMYSFRIAAGFSAPPARFHAAPPERHKHRPGFSSVDNDSK